MRELTQKETTLISGGANDALLNPINVTPTDQLSAFVHPNAKLKNHIASLNFVENYIVNEAPSS